MIPTSTDVVGFYPTRARFSTITKYTGSGKVRQELMSSTEYTHPAAGYQIHPRVRYFFKFFWAQPSTCRAR